MPLVQRQDVDGPISAGQNDDRGIGESQPEVRVPVENVSRTRDIVSVERRELVGPSGNFPEERARDTRRDVAPVVREDGRAGAARAPHEAHARRARGARGFP